MLTIYQKLLQVVKSNARNHSNRYARKVASRTKPDPGIQHRKTIAIDEHMQESNNFEDLEFDLEADFTNVAESHKLYENEQYHRQERLKYLIVKQKYFKEKSPNFLLWSEKLQIRHLYNTNPKEWTIERLSEGFPALPEVIEKIVKSTWLKTTESKIKNHDEAVKRNWNLYKEEKLPELSGELRQHLSKFVDRDLSLIIANIPETNKTHTSNIEMGTEFVEIIKSYERLKNKNAIEESPTKTTKLEKPPKLDTYVIGGPTSKHSQLSTLSHLQSTMEIKSKQGNISSDEALMLQGLQEHNNKLNDSNVCQNQNKMIIDALQTAKYEQKDVSTVRNKQNDFASSVEYPDNIIIPKDKYRKGYTYKLNDCYYDDDGEFLYRVPGMY